MTKLLQCLRTRVLAKRVNDLDVAADGGCGVVATRPNSSRTAYRSCSVPTRCNASLRIELLLADSAHSELRSRRYPPRPASAVGRPALARFSAAGGPLQIAR